MPIPLAPVARPHASLVTRSRTRLVHRRARARRRQGKHGLAMLVQVRPHITIDRIARECGAGNSKHDKNRKERGTPHGAALLGPDIPRMI
jgi:hypothetical protein